MAADAALAGAGLGVLVTGLLLGVRHGFDWDHIAAITDITSTTATTEVAVPASTPGRMRSTPHAHAHGGASESVGATPRRRRCVRCRGRHRADARARPCRTAPRHPARAPSMRSVTRPSSPFSGWPPSPSARCCPTGWTRSWAASSALTLLLLGLWVFVSLYQYARHGTAFRLRSRWMLVFDGGRYAWRRFAGPAPRPRARGSDRDERLRPEDRVRRRA